MRRKFLVSRTELKLKTKIDLCNFLVMTSVPLSILKEAEVSQCPRTNGLAQVYLPDVIIGRCWQKLALDHEIGLP